MRTSPLLTVLTVAGAAAGPLRAREAGVAPLSADPGSIVAADLLRWWGGRLHR